MEAILASNLSWTVKLILCMIPCYLIGSIPFGLIITKFAGYGDIRSYGSGNIGSTNAFRKSKLCGFLTLVCDVSKGSLAVLLCMLMFDDYLLEILGGFTVIIGHIFPIWLNFKGGKGVATALGAFFVTNWIIGLFVVVTWIVAFAVNRISALAAITAFTAAPILTYILTHDLRLILANSFICTLIIIKHHTNIRHIIKMRSK